MFAFRTLAASTGPGVGGIIAWDADKPNASANEDFVVVTPDLIATDRASGSNLQRVKRNGISVLIELG